MIGLVQDSQVNNDSAGKILTQLHTRTSPNHILCTSLFCMSSDKIKEFLKVMKGGPTLMGYLTQQLVILYKEEYIFMKIL